MRTSELDYDLPPELIAQRPLPERDDSRLLVYERVTGTLRHRSFRDLPEELPRGALVVVNDTRVVPARLRVQRATGGEAEVLLLEPVGDGLWEALARPTRRLRPGMTLNGVELVEHRGDGRWLVRLEGRPAGEPPLPPYIVEPLADPDRYQTVYADEDGSAAAPTAGLHFTQELLAGLDVERVTLHVGLDTFRPVSADDLDEHQIHSERYRVEERAWERIRRAERVVAVGTTTVRVLESLARGAPLAGAHEPVRDAGLRVRACGRARDELPPAALDAARARDGVRRASRRRAGCTRLRSTSTIASTPSATRCCSYDRLARAWTHPGHPIPPPAFERIAEKRADGSRTASRVGQERHMTVVRLRLAPVGETMFPPRAPCFDAVREPPGSLTHPPNPHRPDASR